MLAQAPVLEDIQKEAKLPDLGGITIGGLISSILPYVFGAAGIALLIYLVIGGLQMMLSRGDPKAIQSAQAKITNALIGFIIVIISFLLVRLIGQLLGIDVFRPIFGF